MATSVITPDILERPVVPQKQTTSMYCTHCGAYLGEANPGYLRRAMCFCDAVISIPVPTEYIYEIDPAVAFA